MPVLALAKAKLYFSPFQAILIIFLLLKAATNL